MKREPQAFHLADSDLTALLVDAAITPGKSSPLAALDMSSAGAKLPAGSDEIAQAVAVLANPDLRIELVVWPESRHVATFYGNSSENRFVLFSRSQEARRNLVVWPYPAALIRAMALGPLLVAGEEPAARFDTVLADDELKAVAAMTDAAQEQSLRAFIERKPDAELSFGIANLKEIWKAGIAGADPAWLAGRLQLLAPDLLGEDIGDLRGNLETFSARDWISKKKSGYVPNAATLALLRELAPVDAAVSISVGPCRKPDGDGKKPDFSAFWATRSGVWELRPSAPGARSGEVRLRTIARTALEDRLSELLGGKPQTEAARQAPAVCPNCGASTRPGQKFCTECGTSLSGAHESTAPKAPICPNCGAPLTGKEKFCTQCGAAIGGG